MRPTRRSPGPWVAWSALKVDCAAPTPLWAAAIAWLSAVEASASACSSAERFSWSLATACWSWAICWALVPDGAAMVYEPSKPMEPPSCTDVARVVRTTAAVLTEAVVPRRQCRDCRCCRWWTGPPRRPPPLRPGRLRWSPWPRSASGRTQPLDPDPPWPPCPWTPPAGRLPGIGPLGPIPALLTTTSPGGPVPAIHHAGALICLATHLVGVLERRAVRVHAGAVEIGLAIGSGVGVVGDAVGPHAVDVLHQLGLGRRGRNRVGSPQVVLGGQLVLATRTGWCHAPQRRSSYR